MIDGNQNSINTGFELGQTIQNREVFNKFLAKPQKVTCDKPRGYLVKETPLEQFKSSITDTIQDAKNLGSALKDGKSNDTELGRMNDLGMKIGGGLIAGALMGARNTTNKKMMEIAGFATFFTTMSLWPKIAIDLPTKLRHGFNPHQKYVDSNGNKKAFFLDNQYLPWDVWSKEEINQIADKMGVDKNMTDREEYTKEKMRTIALQDNTLWMLTAGFATPLITSLVCNRIEEGSKVPIANRSLVKLAREAENSSPVTNTISKSTIYKQQDAELRQLTDALRKGEVPENFTEKLGNIVDITHFSDNELVSKRVVKNNIEVADDLIQRVLPKSANYDDFLAAIDGDEQAKELFNLAYKEAKMEGASCDTKNIIDRVNGLIDANPDIYADKKWAEKIADGFEGLSPEIKKTAATKSGYDKKTLTEGADALEHLYETIIKPAQEQVRKYGSKVNRLDGISGEKYNGVAKTLINSMGLSSKELEQIRNTDEPGGMLAELLNKKIKDIASDDARYHKTMAKLSKQRDNFETAADGLSGNKVTVNGVFDMVTGKVNETLSNLAGQTDLDDALVDSKLMKNLQRGITENEAQGIKTNITSVNSMVTRLMDSIELERKIGDGSLLSQWAKYAAENGLEGNIEKMSAKECDEFYNLCRRVLWQSSYGDAMNKFNVTGNGGFYKALTDTLFSAQSGSNDTKNWQNAARSIALETDYVPNDSLAIKNACNNAAYAAETAKSHGLKFADYGESVLNTLKKQANQVYNDRRWMKIFGGMAAILVGATFISQLFFGKVKNAHLYVNKNESDSFESGKK